MRTLIVPCAGSRKVDGLPLFLNKHPGGMLLAKKAITGVFYQNYDRIIFSILKEDDENYHASEIIRNSIRNAELVILKEKTSGPAETIYKTLEMAKIEGEFVVRDSHAYLELDKDYTGNFLAGLDLTKFEKPIENLRSKSFIVLNEQKQVLDVVEKHFCSDVISAGVYGFQSTSDFKMAYEHLSDPNYPISKLYVSHIISYLIGYKQRVFHASLISNFEDWSTRTAWQKIQKENATCFMDLDGVCGWSIPLEASIIRKLVLLSKAGIKFVCFTTRSNEIDEMKQYLISNGVNVIAVVPGCTFSKVKNLILSADDLGELALEV